MNSAIRAIQRQPLAMLLLLLGSLLAPFLMVDPASGQSPGTPVEDTGGGGPVADGSTAVPDLAIVVAAGTNTELHTASVRDRLDGLNGIAWTAADVTVQPPQVLVGLDPDAADIGLEAVERALADHPASTELTLAGRALSDREIRNRISTGAFLAGALASLAVGALVAWRLRLRHGLLAGGAVALSAVFGSVLASRAAGPFDGSVATTAVPGLLAAVLVSTYLVFRLLVWFSHPVGVDHAEMIRRSVLSIGVELALFLVGLVVVAVFLETVSPSRAVATVVVAAVVVAAMTTLAVVPPLLAVFHGPVSPSPDHDEPAEPSAGPEGSTPDPGPVFSPFGQLFPGPDGRQVPVGVLLGFGALLAVLSLFSLQGTSPDRLFDDRALDDATAALLEGDGDPTSGIVAHFPDGVDQLAKTAWLQRVSQLPSVARVETATGRFVAGGPADVAAVPLAAAGIDQGDEVPELALVVPTVAARSAGAQDLVEAIEATDAPVGSALSGAPVDARAASQRDGSSVWLLMVALSLISGAAVLALIGDPTLAALSAGLRLVGSAAVVGLYQLLAGDPTGSELQLVVLVTALGAALFELGFLRRLLQGHRTENTDVLVDLALQREGWAAVVAMAVAALAALGLLVVDLQVIRRLGLLLMVAILVEMMIGMWLLRPPLLGDRAVRHFASQPVRAALRTLLGGAAASPEEQERWVAVVAELLHEEFALQAAPADSDLERVFVPDTALFRKATDHHEHLAQAGLRILGREPQLRTVRVVGTGTPVTVAVTVDHPPRQLVNVDGQVLGVRRPERRSVMLWLAPDGDGGAHRIADSVELGIETLGDGAALGTVTAPVSVAAADPASR